MSIFVFQETELPKGMTHDVHLDIVPDRHSLMDVKKLEEDGQQAFDTLIAYMTSETISRCVALCFCTVKLYVVDNTTALR